MLPPEQDIEDRVEIWEAMEIFWLDTDYKIRFERTAEICATSKYSIFELEKIFFNEARPAFKFNLLSIAGEWAGFERDWIIRRVLQTNKFGREKYFRFPKLFSLLDNWNELKKAVIKLRQLNDQ